MQEYLEELKGKVLSGKDLSYAEACWLMGEAPFPELCEAAHAVTVSRASRVFDMCSIVNVKSGHCSEGPIWREGRSKAFFLSGKRAEAYGQRDGCPMRKLFLSA